MLTFSFNFVIGYLANKYLFNDDTFKTFLVSECHNNISSVT